MAKKIGILTYFWSPNPGTFLQAYGTQWAFEQRFPHHRVEVVDLRHRRIYFRPNRRDVAPSNFIAHWRRHFIFKRCRRRHLKMSPRRLMTSDYDEAAAFIEAQGYDLVVVGSDTIFQLLDAYGAKRQPPIYWLPPSLPCRKVACAASAAALKYDQLDGAMRERMAASIRAFDLVGVRDDLTYALMEALGLKGDPRLQRVPDPTFTVPIDPAPAEAFVRRHRIDLSRPTIGINLPARPDGDAIAAYYKAQGYQIVSFDSKAAVDHWLWAIGPFEWAGIHRYFRFEITDRFHGSIFSLRNGTPVIGLEVDPEFYTASGQSKKFSLLREFGLEKTNHVNLDRLSDLKDVVRIVEVGLAAFDRERVLATAERLRQQYLAFVDRVAELL